MSGMVDIPDRPDAAVLASESELREYFHWQGRQELARVSFYRIRFVFSSLGSCHPLCSLESAGYQFLGHQEMSYLTLFLGYHS